MIQVETICDSIGPTGDYTRLFTIKAKAPKFIHQETLRHRTIYIEDLLGSDPDFSFSVSSARAIPFKNLLSEVRSDEFRAEPEFWGTEQKGMSPGDELSDIDEYSFSGKSKKQAAKTTWLLAALDAANRAEQMAAIGIHKSIVNRIIEPYIHVHCLMTATTPGWMNFFGLRLDKAADPTVRALAKAIWREWNESKPKKLQPDQWHLPFLETQDREELANNNMLVGISKIAIAIRISAARCARLSYLSFETQKRSTIEEDLALYNRLAGSLPIHASPMEHQATPDEWGIVDNMHGNDIFGFINPKQSGNLGPGWRQYRKTLANERVAPLPKSYKSW